ncbi:hypothetical protein H2203_005430 [Taxawa tesnikishii (nom. ined.)]|nr:hypothetical protein H2203_005430 [Dothideales sp. JES 119]
MSRDIVLSRRRLEAYVSARDYLRKELLDSKEKAQWLDGNTSMVDVASLVESKKAEYETSSEKRRVIRKHFDMMSSRIMHYGQVMDMLSQHHPEYVALAWGTAKFVLMGILNHAELVNKFAQAFKETGDVLPRAAINADLYPTNFMKDIISKLYAYIMLFYHRAAIWYNMGPARRALSSVELQGHRIAAGAELRDTHVKVQNTRIALQSQFRLVEAQSSKIKDMQRTLVQVQLRLDDLLAVGTSHKSISERITIDVGDMKPRTYDIQISTIMSILDPKIDPVVLLTKSSSLAKRRRAFGSTVKDHKSLMQDLHTWFCAEGSSLFVLRAGPRAETEAKGIAVDVVNLLRPTPYRVLWNLSPTSMSDSAISTTAVLKGLVHQALQKDTDFLLHNPEQLNFVKFQSDHTEEEWLHLLSLLFARLPKSFWWSKHRICST